MRNYQTGAINGVRWIIKPVLFVLCLSPAVAGLLGVIHGKLGANPVEAILHLSGEWALRLLLLTLMVTPLQRISRRSWVAQLRRMVGLFAFFYATLHVLIWLVLEQGLDVSQALREVLAKPFIMVGMVAIAGMLILALTSNKWSVRKLGRRWKALHRTIYLLSVLAIVHFVWQVKGADLVEPGWYLVVLIGLLGWRFQHQSGLRS